MTEPFFSIITVAKNHSSGVKLTGKSILSQLDAPQFEWIVIDGASTDYTAAVMQDFERDNVIFLSEPDRNMCHAMNKGLDRATGRYVWFLKAGDCLSDAYVLRDLSRELRAHLSPEFAYGDARDNGVLHKARPFGAFSKGRITHHQAMLYLRKLIGDLRFEEDFPIAADYAFTLKFQDKAMRIHYSPRVLCDCITPILPRSHSREGGREQYKIREEYLGMHPWRNRMLFWQHTFLIRVQERSPKLARRLRTLLQ